jgi:LPPG:FO 2-phospho-L-lactate transferase
MILALTGGTGGAKLIQGLAAEIDPDDLTIVCNTADDAIFHGLYVSPDIDTITYTLAGVIDQEKGWGRAGESFGALEQLGCLGEDVWFKLGDKDLATHILRTRLLRDGVKLSEITRRIRTALAVRSEILPMSDERVETRVFTSRGEMSFQEYFVRERWAPEVTRVSFAGVERSNPAPRVLGAIRSAAAIVVCPSNPVTSIGPILSVPEIRQALVESQCKIIGVSPIVAGRAVSGPAHKLMKIQGLEPSATGVARGYADFLDVLLIAVGDKDEQREIEKLGVQPVTTNVAMNDMAGKRRLAREVLALL